MNYAWTFIWIIIAFASISFWEAYIEGRHGGAAKQVGWVWKIFGLRLTGYHIMLFGVTIPLFLLLPIIAYGYDTKLLATVACGYLIGIIIEDFLWFVVNPAYPFRQFRADKVWWYPWIKFGRWRMPLIYPVALALALIIWGMWLR
ncbi:hypothetical protein KKG41_00560 [Patescibacteria group bacterium]|nr:hypothetical protein [Patescibacteria group bacterium]MBU1890299.1 hypothetical protein [Patescibacteria group bacterium]